MNLFVRICLVTGKIRGRKGMEKNNINSVAFSCASARMWIIRKTGL